MAARLSGEYRAVVRLMEVYMSDETTVSNSDVVIPENVRKQGDDARKMYEDALKPEGSEQNTGTDEEQSGKALHEEGTEGVEQGDDVDEQEADSEQDAETEETPDKDDDPASEDPAYQKLAQAHDVLKGKYNTEIKRLAQEVRDLKRQSQHLLQDNNTLRDTLAKLQSPKQDGDDHEGASDQLSPDDYKEWGPEMVRLARENLRLTRKLQGIEQSVGQVRQAQAQTVEDRFYDAMDSLSTHWRELNEDPDFNAWLDDLDIRSGLNEACSALDAQRAARIVNRYVKESGRFADDTRPGPTDPPTRQRKSEKLTRKVAPARGRAHAPARDTGKRTYSLAEINEFYRKLSVGDLNQSDPKVQAQYQDILAAAQEGGRIA